MKVTYRHYRMASITYMYATGDGIERIDMTGFQVTPCSQEAPMLTLVGYHMALGRRSLTIPRLEDFCTIENIQEVVLR